AAVGNERDLASECQRKDTLGDDLDVAGIAARGIAHLVAPQDGKCQFRERLEADDIDMPALDHRQGTGHVVAVESLSGTDSQPGYAFFSPGRIPRILAMMPSIPSSAPAPIESRRESRKAREIGVSSM